MSSHPRLFFAAVIVAAAFVFWPASAPGQSGNEKIPETGAISGRVTIAGKNAANITVAAYSPETISQRKSAARAVTDTEGRYRLTGLAAAQYQITSLTPDLTTADQTQVNDFGFVIAASSKSITLAAGEEVENIDLKLVRGGVITGRVTDANNKPVVEEQISLIPVDDNGNQSRNMRIPFGGSDLYQTDDRGVYRIYGLAPGRYKVSAGIESGGGIGGVRGFYARTFYPDTPDQTKARVVEVSEGSEASDIDIQLGRQEETYSASGRVVDGETGEAVVGAQLSYLVATENPGRYSPFYIGDGSGKRGEFKLTGLSPGRFGVYLSSEFEGGDYFSEITYFDVVDKDVTGLEVKARRGLTLGGVVVVEGAGPSKSPAQTERLRISASAMQQSQPQERNAGTSTIAQDGSFHIGGLRAGRFSLFVYAAGGTSSPPLITRIERDGITVTPSLELQAGQSVSDLRVIVSYGTGAIHGSVRFVGGVPAADTRLVVRCTRDGTQTSGGTSPDARGHFLIKNLSAGTYEVTLLVLRNGLSSSPQQSVSPQKQIVQVTNDGESEVTFLVDLTPKPGP